MMSAAGYTSTYASENGQTGGRIIVKSEPPDEAYYQSQSESPPPNDASIATLVFFDTEATGLPRYNGPSNVYATELCFMAVSSRAFVSSENGLPRVMNKLSFCVKPRVDISAEAERITGLNSDLLETQMEFTDATAKQIYNFIKDLPEPVCLLAHNGQHFDFPLLRSELDAVGWSLPGRTTCADTLLAMRDIISNHMTLSAAHIPPSIAATCVSRELLEETFELSMSCLNDPIADNFEDFNPPEENDSRKRERSNVFTTPPSLPSKQPRLIRNGISGLRNSYCEVTPPSTSQKNSFQANSQEVFVTPVRRRLEFGSPRPVNSVANSRAHYAAGISASTSWRSGQPRSRIRYALKDLHKMFLGSLPEKSHAAEDDCIALMKVCHKVKHDFLQWINENSVPFSTVNSMR